MTLTPSSTSTVAALTLKRAPAQAIASLLALLDRPSISGAVVLAGKQVGKSALVRDLAQRSAQASLRTPQGHFVLSAIVDAAALPASLRPWQHLIYVVLDVIRRRSRALPSLDTLRQQFDDVLRLQQRDDPAADFALAAFVHHFRATFGSLLENLSESVLALVIDHLDKADPEDAKELLEAAQYFLNAPRCVVIFPVDETRLPATLREMLLGWAIARIALEEGTFSDAAQPQPAPQPAHSVDSASAHSAPPSLRDLPEHCARVLLEALQPDHEAVARAAIRWRAAMRVLSTLAAEGRDVPISAVHVARLCALREMLPPLFEAALRQPTLLTQIERHVRSAATAPAPNEWTRMVLNHPRAKALFASPSAAAFLTLNERALRSAMQAVSGSSELIRPASAEEPLPTTQTPQANARPAEQLKSSALAEIAALSFLAALGFGIDRAIKAVALSSSIPLDSPFSAPTWSPPDLTTNLLSLTAALTGIALCTLLIIVFDAHRRNLYARLAYALLLGGFGALLADHLTFGAPMNIVRLPNMPLFSPAHVLIALGAVILAGASFVRRSPHWSR
ncbi:MAG: AAA family ATPase [Thermoflexales bacterium]|nr:AAA family ATPase [Thermoflexales bacterium]MCS7325328.1 AAA family ATPase [Thermoflexales bacterium]MCX7939715.1 AAA family ATPase [Thermoflexales bacterium]MDW8054610.1 ATP-binding protein [Anaerolineae bacterium]